MFKCVNAVSGSLSDLKEAHKKKLNVTLARHAVRILLSILLRSGWSLVPVGRCIVLLSVSQKVTERQRPSQLMALQSRHPQAGGVGDLRW